MNSSLPKPTASRRFARPAPIAASLLLSAAAAYVWAHAGHAPLPTKGAQVDVAKGLIVLSRAAREALDVRAAEVALRPVEGTVLAYATLVAPWQRHAYVAARLGGRVVKQLAQPGQSVKPGQVLAEVESLELEALRLELKNAQNDLRLSEKVVSDLERISNSGSISGQSLVEAQSKHQQNRNALDVARAKWLSLGLPEADLDELLRREDGPAARTLPVRSLVGGTIIHADLAVGKVVEPSEHLFEVVDLSSVWVKVGVLERDLRSVAAGQPIELRLAAYPGETFRTTVTVQGPYLDPVTHLNTVWAELANPSGAEPRFLPGMAGEARLILPGTAAGKAVPAAAVFGEGAERFVLVEEAGTAGASQYQKRSVAVGRQTPEVAEVQSGDLYPGDRVVTQGGHELAGFFVPGVLRLSPEARRGIGLQLEAAGPQVVEEVAEVDGTVDVLPDHRASASARLAGTLQAVQADRGQAVRAGEVLAEVASLELDNLQLDLLKAHLDYQLQEETLRRLRTAGVGVSPRRLLDQEGLVNSVRNQRDSIRRRLEAVGLTGVQLDALLKDRTLVEALPVKAPIDGVVASFDKVLGQALKAEEPLFEVHDLSRPLVQGFVSERDLASVHVDQTARVRLVAAPDAVLEGTVVRSGRVFGPESRTLAVWVEVPADSRRPYLYNQLARLSLTVRRPAPTLAVPLAALVTEGTRAFVFVQMPDGTFDRRAVTTGRSDDRRVEVTGGLQVGESVAVRGVPELQTAFAGLR